MRRNYFPGLDIINFTVFFINEFELFLYCKLNNKCEAINLYIYLSCITNRLIKISEINKYNFLFFFQSGMRVSPTNQFSVQLFAHQAGQVNVKLEVTPTTNSPYVIRDGFSLVDELQIKV